MGLFFVHIILISCTLDLLNKVPGRVQILMMSKALNNLIKCSDIDFPPNNTYSVLSYGYFLACPFAQAAFLVDEGIKAYSTEFIYNWRCRRILTCWRAGDRQDNAEATDTWGLRPDMLAVTWISTTWPCFRAEDDHSSTAYRYQTELHMPLPDFIPQNIEEPQEYLDLNGRR
jgi:hypothetical protein